MATTYPDLNDPKYKLEAGYLLALGLTKQQIIDKMENSGMGWNEAVQALADEKNERGY